MAQVRLQKYLAQSGLSARRKAEELITSGRVAVNGRVVKVLGSKVDPDHDTVKVDGKFIEPEELVYLVLNKPKGVITSVSDPQGRKTVMEILPALPARVAPVGRLDYYTEGVLLLTNDGELAAALLAPRSKIEKIYHVKIRGKVSHADLAKLRAGVRLEDGRRTLPAQVDVLNHSSKHTWLVMTIREGRSRQIHRMAEALGYMVIKLARVAFAGITYFGLRVGESRRLSAGEVRTLRKLAGLDEESPRGKAKLGTAHDDKSIWARKPGHPRA